MKRIAHHKPGMNGARNKMMMMMMMAAKKKDATKHRYVSSLQNEFDGLCKPNVIHLKEKAAENSQ